MAALLSAGAEVDATDRKGQTALHYAARWGNSPAIKALMGMLSCRLLLVTRGRSRMLRACLPGASGGVGPWSPGGGRLHSQPHPTQTLLLQVQPAARMLGSWTSRGTPRWTRP